MQTAIDQSGPRNSGFGYSLKNPEVSARVRCLRRLRRKRTSLSRLIRIAVAWVAGIITVLPALWLVLASLRPAEDTFSSSLPHRLTIDNFVEALTTVPIPRYLVNSAFISVTVTIAALLFHSMAAYALARLRFKGRDVIFTAMISTMLISIPVILVPLFLIVKSLGMIDTYAGLIVPSTFNAFGIFLLRQYYLNIPKELEEAAELDGCGYFRLYWSVILPLGKPIMAALAVLFFLANWNAFIWPLAITNSNSLDVIQLGISAFQGQFSSAWNLILAASVIAAIPTIVIFLIGQRWLVDSLKTTGIK